jgi:CheY-like chemotaxis protein
MSRDRQKTLILIVEDDPASLMIATVALQGAGYAAEGAESAELAREVVARQKPDLILMDIALPGMDGLEFAKELKSDPLTAAIPIVALTAHGMPLYERSARSAGCIGFITKPVSPGALVTQVRSFLEVSTEAAR